jgi:hypothetical protein
VYRRARGYQLGHALGAVDKEDAMNVILAVLLLALLFGGLGFAIHALWVIAVVLLVIWILGFLLRGAEASWYRW